MLIYSVQNVEEAQASGGGVQRHRAGVAAAEEVGAWTWSSPNQGHPTP